MKKYRNIAIIIGVYLCFSVVIKKVFKVNYYKSNIFRVEQLQIDENVQIPSGLIALGKNRHGFIEGVVFPDAPYYYGEKGQIEYVYIKFPPSWYANNVAPNVTEQLNSSLKSTASIFKQAKVIHKENFHHLMHTNDFPIVREDLIGGKIKLVGLIEKLDFFIPLGGEEQLSLSQ